jgi:hypothetical protein
LAAKLGRNIPIYGGADSRTEHLCLAAANRIIRGARYVTGAQNTIGPDETATEMTPGKAQANYSYPLHQDSPERSAWTDTGQSKKAA